LVFCYLLGLEAEPRAVCTIFTRRRLFMQYGSEQGRLSSTAARALARQKALFFINQKALFFINLPLASCS
jgi:hypothetical protein